MWRTTSTVRKALFAVTRQASPTRPRGLAAEATSVHRIQPGGAGDSRHKPYPGRRLLFPELEQDSGRNCDPASTAEWA